MSNSSPKRTQLNPATPTPSFLTIADLILPWLTPQELSSLSCTSHTLSHLSKQITTVRSSDASRSHEPNPIPFINTVDSHPYSYFLYTPTHLIPPPPPPSRQPWGPTTNNFNNNNIPNIQFDGFGGSGCDCGEKCDGFDDCPCLVLGYGGGDVRSECGPGCDCGLGCGNRVSQRGVGVRLKVVRVESKGWGLFAHQFIPSRHFVCEYAGELLTTQEARKRQKVYDQLARGSRFCSGLLVVREYLPSRKACFRINIDATTIGNVARFINHSCDGGNLSTVLIRSSGAVVPRVCFFSSGDIQAGEELSFSYGDVRQRPEGMPCYCGSPHCFGVMPSEDT